MKKKNELIMVCSNCKKVLVIIKSIELRNISLNFRILCNECYQKLDQSQKQPDDWVGYVDKHYQEWKKHKEEFDKKAEEQLERFEYKPEKQPEDWRNITVGQLMEDRKKAVEFLKNNPDFIKETEGDKESLAFQSLVKPEKQEEWREIDICKNCFGNNIGRKYHDADYKKGVKVIGIKVCLDCGCEDICNLGDLSQLLSERYEVGCKDGARGFFEGVLKHLEDREETKDSIKGRIELSKVLLEVYKIDLSKLLKEGE